MGTFKGLAAATALMLGTIGMALAQAPGTNGGHSAHHPQGVQATPGAPERPPQQGGTGMGGPGGMMGGERAGMMRMMQERRMAMATQPFRRVEGQLAFIRAELRITDAQASQWNTFAEAVRAQSGRLHAAVQASMQGAMGATPAPQQIERRIALLSAQLEAMRAVSAAAGPLYAALSEEQRRTADELMAEHFRSMRMGMP